MFRQFLGFAQGEIGRCARLTSPFGEFGHSRRQIHRMATLGRNTYGVGMAKNLVVIGAGPGLGAAIANRFAHAGFSIGLIARDDAMLTELSDELTAGGTTCFVARADVTDADELREALDSLDALLGTPDVVLSNTSMFVEATPTEVSPEVFETVWRVACLSSLIALQQVVPAMRERGTGVFLMPGTPLALKPWPPGAALGAAKAAARNFVMNAGAELAPDGIHAAVVTIDGVIKDGTEFSPAKIAERFFTVSELAADKWRQEYVYSGNA